MISGAFRTSCSHARLRSAPVGAKQAPLALGTPHSALPRCKLVHRFARHVGRVIKPYAHRQASLPWEKAFDPDIIVYTFRQSSARNVMPAKRARNSGKRKKTASSRNPGFRGCGSLSIGIVLFPSPVFSASEECFSRLAVLSLRGRPLSPGCSASGRRPHPPAPPHRSR